MLKQPPSEPRGEPPMMHDYRLAATVAVVLIVTLLAAACAASRQVQGSVGSATPEPAMATRVAAAQAQADATRQAVATSAAVIDATAGAQNTATAATQVTMLAATPSPSASTAVQPSAASLATPVPTITIQPTPTSSPGPVLYVANFATWDSGEKAAPYPARLTYDSAAKEYRISLTDPKRAYAYQVYSPDPHRFDDFQLDVDARHIAGPDNGSYGVLFRIQPRAANDKANADYAVLVHPNEEYVAFNLLMADGVGKNLGKGNTLAIKKGDATNHLTVICRGDKVTLAINGQTVGVYPATLLTAGTVGLVVSSPPDPSGPVGMEVAFSNLRVSSTPRP